MSNLVRERVGACGRATGCAFWFVLLSAIVADARVAAAVSDRAPEARNRESRIGNRTVGYPDVVLLEHTEERIRFRLDVASQLISPADDAALVRASGLYLVPHERAKLRLPFRRVHIGIPRTRTPRAYARSLQARLHRQIRRPQTGTWEPVRILGTGVLRGQKICTLDVRPFQMTNDGLLVHELLEITLDLEPQARGGQVRHAEADNPIEDVLEMLLLNHEQSRSWRTRGEGRAQPWEPPPDSYKVLLDSTGLYELSYGLLSSAGIPVDEIDPRTIRVFNRGEEVALVVEGEEDGVFGEEDAVVFWGHFTERADAKGRQVPCGSRYTETNVYWLSWGGAPGTRMSARHVEPVDPELPVAQWFPGTLHLEEDHNPFVPDEEATSGDRFGDEWFWQELRAATDSPVWGSYSFDIPAVATASPETCAVRIALQGFTHPAGSTIDHHAVLWLNGHKLADVFWRGQRDTLYISEEDYYGPVVPLSWLQAYGNSFSVEVPGDSPAGAFDAIYTDWFELDYWSLYHAEGRRLTFRAPEAGHYRFHVDGFEQPDVELYDLNGPTRLLGADAETWGAGYRVVFEDLASDTTVYAAWERGRRLSPLEIVPDGPSAWGTPEHGADYLIIVHEELVAAAELIQSAWQAVAPALRVEIVQVEDVYDEFNWGVFHPGAIRDLLEYAYHWWEQGAPGHVLLLGDATWDYKLSAEDSDPDHRNFVPSWGNPVCDDLLAAVDGEDLLPDYVIARLPVENADTALVVAEKIASYLSTAYTDTTGWRENVLLVADYHSARLFETQSEELADSFIVPPPAHFTPLKIYKDNEIYYPEGVSSPEGSTAVAYMNGPGVVAANYLGHGGTWTWGTIFWGVDVEQRLQNGLRVPFVTSMTCHTGRFANPYIDSFGEIWMWQPNGGAVAFFGTTGWGSSLWDKLQVGYLYRHLFLDQDRRIGDVCLASKVAFADSEGYSSTFLNVLSSPLNYVLLGDPYMKLALAPRPDMAVGTGDVSLAPAVPVEGDTIHITGVIRNLGPDGSPAVPVRFSFSRGGPWTPLGDVVLPAIEPGGSEDVEATWFPESAGPGSLMVAADPDSQVREGREDNNAAVIPVLVLERKPDVAVSEGDVFWQPAQPDPTQSPLTLGAVVHNVGTVPAVPVEVLFGLGDSVAVHMMVGRDTLETIEVGDSVSARVLWDVHMGDVGTHTIWVHADPDDRIGELRETNNIASAEFEVLSPADLSVSPGDILFSNPSPPVGDSITVWAVVHNLGAASASGVEVWFYDQHPDSLDGGAFGRDTLAVSGEVQDTAAAWWPTEGNAGWNTIYVVVDPLDEVEEPDEDNNTASRDILVLDAPDLFVQTIAVDPALPVEGDTVTFTLRVRNAARVAADSFEVILLRRSETGAEQEELLRVWQDLPGETTDSLSAVWDTKGRSGLSWVVATIDPGGVVAESNEFNNRDSTTVLVLRAPDLDLEAWAEADTVAVGDSLVLGLTVANLGEGRAEGVRATLVRGDTLLAEDTLGSLEGGAVAETNLRWDDPSLGFHQLLVRARLDGWEPDSLNNTDTVHVTVRQRELPDVWVQASPSETSIVHGDTLAVTCDLVNLGEQAAQQVHLTLTVGEEVLDGPVWEVLDSGERANHIFRVVPPPGYHQCWTRATAVTADADSTNNLTAFSVLVASRPDLEPISMTFVPPQAVKGDTIWVQLGVRNGGDLPVGFFAVAFFVGDPLLVPVRSVVEVYQGLAAGESTTVLWPWDTLPDSGAVSVTVWLDPDQGVREEDETNNRLAASATVLPDDEPPRVLFTRREGGVVVDGEFFSPGESVLVVLRENASGIDSAALSLSVDGIRLVWGEDYTILASHGLRRGGTVPLALSAGQHTVAVDSVLDGSGNAAEGGPFTVEVEVSSRLRVREVLAYPNPSQGATALSALCSSSDASGWFTVHALGGTTVARLEAAGSGSSLMAEWDGRDREGSPVANGVYLVQLVATAGAEKATSRGKVVIWR